jgi:hypothetical protein
MTLADAARRFGVNEQGWPKISSEECHQPAYVAGWSGRQPVIESRVPMTLTAAALPFP